MKIGFDISQTGDRKAGCGYFADAAIRALIDLAAENSYTLFNSFGGFFFDPDFQPRRPFLGPNIGYGPKHETRAEATAFWTGQRLSRRLADLDVVQANNYWCPSRPIRPRVIYTLHDLSFMHDPSWHTEVNRTGCSAGVADAVDSADWINAVSGATRHHLLRAYPSFPSERVQVIYPCSRFEDAPVGERPAIRAGIEPGCFWLSVGTLEPRKNLTRLISAYARYHSMSPAPAPLVLAGQEGWLMDDLRSLIANLNVDEDVILAGYVRDAELAWLYGNCRAHIYVSLFEGFGLPVLEGMQFGAPTIASKSTSIPEITGDAAVLVDPLCIDDILNALVRVDGNRRWQDALSTQSLWRARLFTRRRMVRGLLSLYERALRSPKRRTLGLLSSWSRSWSRNKDKIA